MNQAYKRRIFSCILCLASLGTTIISAKAHAADFLDRKSSHMATPTYNTQNLNQPETSSRSEQNLQTSQDVQNLEQTATNIASKEESAPSLYTLEQAVNYALNQNPLTFNAELDVEKAGYDLRSAYGALLPSVDAEYGFEYKDNFPHPDAAGKMPHTYSKGFMWSVTATQPLFAGFALLSAREQVHLAKDSQELAQEQTDLLIGMQVQNAFIALLQNEDTIKSTLRAIERAEEQLAFIRASYELSLRPKLDVLQAELELASLENTLVQVQNRRNTSLVNLQTLLALPLSSNTEFVGSLKKIKFEKDFEECLNAAMENRNDLKLGRLAVSMAEEGKTITDAAFYPRIALIAAYSEQDQDSTLNLPAAVRGLSIGVGVTWNIFSGTRRINESAKARIEISKARNSLMDAMNNAAKEVKTLYDTVQEAKKSIEITSQAVKLAEEGYALAMARYENGVGTNLDLLIGQASLAEQEANYTAALAGYLTALSSLHAAMGEKHILDL